VLNSRNFYQLNWINLNQICKRYKGNNKTEKEKKKRKKNMKLDPGETIRPSTRNGPRPANLKSRTGTSSPLSPADWWDPLVSTRSSSTSSRNWRRRPRPSPPLPPLQFHSMPVRFDALPTPISSHRPPLHFPLHSTKNRAARLPKSLAGVRRCCGLELRNPVRPGYPASPHRP
jgi:hypothetical protein